MYSYLFAASFILPEKARLGFIIVPGEHRTMPPLKLSSLPKSALATQAGFLLSRALPPRLGYAVATRIADFLATRRDSSFVRAILANQWVVHGGQIDAPRLKHLVIETYQNSARSLYEFWHYLRNPQAILDMTALEPGAVALIERAQRAKQGTLIVSAHVGNFDLAGRALALRGLPLHVLSFPDPPGGYSWQNRLRAFENFRVTPMSVEALGQASETLRSGRTVITVIDRVLETGAQAKYRPRFFGRPASLPVFYIRLALKHHLPVTVLTNSRDASGRYHLTATDPIELRPSKDLVEETVTNSETILEKVAEAIRKAPNQWAMFYPVWPEALDEVRQTVWQ